MLNKNDDDSNDKKRKKQEETGEAAAVQVVVWREGVFELGGVYLRTMVFLKKLKSL